MYVKHPIHSMTCAGFWSCIILTSSLPQAHGGDAPSHCIMAGPSKGTWAHLHQGARWSLQVHQENVGTSFLVILIFIVPLLMLYFILKFIFPFYSCHQILFKFNIYFMFENFFIDYPEWMKIKISSWLFPMNQKLTSCCFFSVDWIITIVSRTPLRKMIRSYIKKA